MLPLEIENPFKGVMCPFGQWRYNCPQGVKCLYDHHDDIDKDANALVSIENTGAHQGEEEKSLDISDVDVPIQQVGSETVCGNDPHEKLDSVTKMAIQRSLDDESVNEKLDDATKLAIQRSLDDESAKIQCLWCEMWLNNKDELRHHQNQTCLKVPTYETLDVSALSETQPTFETSKVGTQSDTQPTLPKRQPKLTEKALAYQNETKRVKPNQPPPTLEDDTQKKSSQNIQQIP